MSQEGGTAPSNGRSTSVTLSYLLQSHPLHCSVLQHLQSLCPRLSICTAALQRAHRLCAHREGRNNHRGFSWGAAVAGQLQ